MMRFLHYLCCILALGLQAQNPNRHYISHTENGNILSVTTNQGDYVFQFYAEAIVETTFVPNTDDKARKSHAVVMSPKPITPISIGVFDALLTFSSSALTVTIQKHPFQISYSYKGQPIISEKRGYYKSKHIPMPMIKGNIVADSLFNIEFNLSQNEILYGGGSRALGMNRRGHRLPLFNRAHYGYETTSKLMNFTLPIVASSKQYMIHFDNAPVGYLDLDSTNTNTLTYQAISGRKTYQIIAGDNWYDVIDNYTSLTGKQPMLPRWALGNFSSRFGYRSQNQTLKTIEAFKDESIPVDAVILDLYWFGKTIKGTMGNLEFHKDSFQNPKQMITDLRKNNVETILITEPFILTNSKTWDNAVAKDALAKDSVGQPAKFDFYFGNTGLVDIYSSNGKQWFSNIYKKLANFGITGFWGDLGEPEVHPHWVQHATGSAQEVHNIYGHDWAKLVYTTSLKAKPNLRPFVLMRAGYSGSQRYGLVPWSGDVNRTWGGLQSQPEIALQMGMQGLAYMHSDLGGFAGDNLDDELYVRWLQYGVFQPIYRPHAQDAVPSEPVFRSEKAKRLAKFAIQMRYRMLPYNYHLMYENHNYGKPLMRPLFFEEPTNTKLFNYSKTYLWGNDILVSPVLEPNIKTQEVYFPKGSVWFNIENDSITLGGQTQNIAIHKAYIPTYVRGGAFIPLAAPMASTKNYNDTNLELHYYHYNQIKASKRELYMDDGKTVSPMQKKAYQLLQFSAEKQKRWLHFNFKATTGKAFTPATKTVNLIIHNIKNAPKRIKVNRKTTVGNYNAINHTLRIKMDWNTINTKTLRVKLTK